ncbi:MAG: MFS transporter [Betaproteobacteria bacterium]|nr:MFS transporter [Betaproteobacteria bacterium]
MCSGDAATVPGGHADRPARPQPHGSLLNPLHLLYLACFLSQSVFLSAQFALLLYALQLPLSPTMAGLLISLGGLGPALIAVNIGKFIDRRGARSPMLVALAAQLAGAALPALSQSLPVLFLSSFISGTAFIVFRIASQQTVGRLGDGSTRAKHFGHLGLVYSVATVAVPLAAGYAIDHAGFAATFLGNALLALLPLVAIASSIIAIPGPAASAASGGRGNSAFALLRDPALRRLMVATVIINGAWDVFMFLAPVYGSQLQWPASRIGTLTGSFAAGAMFVRAIVSLLTARFTSWQILVMALALAGACFALMPAFVTLPLLLAIAFLGGMGMGVALPVTMALIFETAPVDRAGEVIGLRTLINNVSQASIPLLAGAVGALIGLAPVFWGLATAMLGMSWSSRAYWRSHRRKGQSPGGTP